MGVEFESDQQHYTPSTGSGHVYYTQIDRTTNTPKIVKAVMNMGLKNERVASYFILICCLLGVFVTIYLILVSMSIIPLVPNFVSSGDNKERFIESLPEDVRRNYSI